jgi:hypothetical protein
MCQIGELMMMARALLKERFHLELINEEQENPS